MQVINGKSMGCCTNQVIIKFILKQYLSVHFTELNQRNCKLWLIWLIRYWLGRMTRRAFNLFNFSINSWLLLLNFAKTILTKFCLFSQSGFTQESGTGKTVGSWVLRNLHIWKNSTGNSIDVSNWNLCETFTFDSKTYIWHLDPSTLLRRNSEAFLLVESTCVTISQTVEFESENRISKRIYGIPSEIVNTRIGKGQNENKTTN